MICFNSITFKNFLSVGELPVTIQLNKKKTTLVHGKNGSGKSTILDAICYALFAKPFRKINLPQLVNTQNKKGLLVEVNFTIGRNKYSVMRGQKPKVFQIIKNGEVLQAKAADKDNQAHLENNILKLTYKSFCQIVVLGSSNFVPFMQLSTQARRECVEDFLDIKVFSAMSIIAKERLRGLKDNHDDMERDMSTLTYKMELQRDRIEEIIKRSETDINLLETDIKERLDKISKLNELIHSTVEHQNNVIELAKHELRNNPQKKIKEYSKIITNMESKRDRILKDLDFYESHSECPTCDQTITPEAKDRITTKNKNDSDELEAGISELQQRIEKSQDVIDHATRRQEHVKSLQDSVYKYQTQVNLQQNEVSLLEMKLVDTKGDTSSVDKEKGKLEMMEEDMQSMRDKIFSLQDKINEHEMVVTMLKDGGIKAQIVKKYLPIMNQFIRKYLVELDFPIHFVLDNEFSETISSPLHQNFTYSSFSEGQKARVNIALLLTWRELGKLKNSISTNLLILDEVFSSSLDDSGTELLLKLLRFKMGDENNIFVINHSLTDDLAQKFDERISVSNLKGFSHYSIS